MTTPDLFPALALFAIVMGLNIEVYASGGCTSVVLYSGSHRVEHWCSGDPAEVIGETAEMLSDVMALWQANGIYRWTVRPASDESARNIGRIIAIFTAEALRANGMGGHCCIEVPVSEGVQHMSLAAPLSRVQWGQA